MANPLREALEQRTLLADGGVGTSLLALAGTPPLEPLNLQRPDAVERVHAGFLVAGCDAVTTNTFGGDPPTLAARGLAGRARELCLAGARIARASASLHAHGERPRFVLGSLGPGLLLPTREPLDLDELARGYEEQARALLDGGVDALVIETCRDLLQARAAVGGASRARERCGADALLAVSFAPDPQGGLAGATSLTTAVARLEPLGVELFALNCVEGPVALAEPLAELRAATRLPLGAWPNAGSPRSEDGRTVWPLGPEAFAAGFGELARELDLRLVGGCCGTTPSHLERLGAALRAP